MRSRYAVERRCSHRRERFQLAFAQAAIDLIPRYEDAAYEPSGAGLLLLAETELALEKPMTRLRQAYGEDVQFDPPAVRYERGPVLMEPHMGLRVICNPAHFTLVRRDLALRGALLLDAEVTEQFGVLRVSRCECREDRGDA